ncbi:hypothetical protein DP113_29980 [Brasilonema octagenarum UFV-E1]|uniref:Uncharacterized protein n=2 Tax=Brasilonema TaxID=383614 RepID=A0A856MMC5_9CYAN|nr:MULTISPECIES: hypothetical protein [Brasilonema]NMF67370.1 hypothetical protein [Brasilonema octagenarum UFV-OR1]QDL11539.1 hypothetical protein DP114_29820 [Brasilonema sennae CENA114]QDL17921.1 hypothetical protein DP113_29980 [Brasilonema octagenarum UFV-E1]
MQLTHPILKIDLVQTASVFPSLLFYSINQADKISFCDTLNSTSYGDSIDANEGNDIVYAGGGNDYISGASGNDSLYGKDGNDRPSLRRQKR